MVAPHATDAQGQGRNAGTLTVPINVADFVGTFTITRFDRLQDDTIVAIGTVVGRRGTNPVVGVQQVAVPVTQIVPGSTTCEILTLVLGPLHLDLLGLVVDLNQVILEITGQTGAGNLLGNLLCAIAGLLDPGGLLDGLARNILNQIVQLLNRILGRL